MPDDLSPFNPDPNPTLASEEPAIDELLKKEASLQETAAHVHSAIMWRIGFHYRRVVDGELWKQGTKANGKPYKSAEDWVTTRYRKSATVLHAAAGVCRAFRAGVASKYEFNANVQFLVWANLIGLSPLPEDPGDTPIPVPGRKGAKTTKRFAECSVDDIRRAIRGLKGPKMKTLSPEAAERLTRMKAKLTGVLPDGYPFPVKVVTKKKEEHWGLEPMPKELFDKVIAGLYGARAPVPLTLPATQPVTAA